MIRQAGHSNALVDERQALDAAIETERERITSPPRDRDDARERMREAAAPFAEAIATRGAVPDIQSDGLKWWQRAAMHLAIKARDMALALTRSVKDYWQGLVKGDVSDHNRERDNGGLDR